MFSTALSHKCSIESYCSIFQTLTFFPLCFALLIPLESCLFLEQLVNVPVEFWLPEHFKPGPLRKKNKKTKKTVVFQSNLKWNSNWQQPSNNHKAVLNHCCNVHRVQGALPINGFSRNAWKWLIFADLGMFCMNNKTKALLVANLRFNNRTNNIGYSF